MLSKGTGGISKSELGSATVGGLVGVLIRRDSSCSELSTIRTDLLSPGAASFCFRIDLMGSEFCVSEEFDWVSFGDPSTRGDGLEECFGCGFTLGLVGDECFVTGIEDAGLF